MNSFTGAMALDLGRTLLSVLRLDPAERLVLLLLPHSPELFCLQIALTVDGYVPAVLPWPTSRIDADKYQRNLVHQLAGLPASRLITLPTLAGNLAPGLPFRVSAVDIPGHEAFEKAFRAKFSIATPDVAPGVGQAPPPLPEHSLFLQFSGGTTGTQKCVVVTEEMFRSQLTRLQDALSFTSKDTVASWLPLYHDMGLIACLWLPLFCGASSVQIAASDWLMAPQALFHFIEQYQATFCWLPNFAFAYLAQRRPAMRGNWKLGSVRSWVNCSEPVRLASMQLFLRTFADWGVSHRALQASYAMAETVYAVTQSSLGEFPHVVSRRLVEAAGNGVSFSMPDDFFVSSGRLLPDTRVRVVDHHGNVTAPRTAGEIQVRTPSLFAGYWGCVGLRTDCFSTDGWYRTGDYGFLFDDELYVIGRLKDVIIVGGQNVFPEDIEFTVNQVNGVYPGRAVAFGVDDEQYGTQAIGVVAELKDEAHDPAIVEREVRERILTAIGIAPRYARVVPERWIVKSTAGKISRRETREKFMSELRASREEIAT